jgi:cytolethal distending toxin subunit A
MRFKDFISAELKVSTVVALALFPVATHAEPVSAPVMLVNVKTNKCLTIAGGVSADNNVPTVQFNCDSDPSRRWMLHQTGGDIFQIKNVRTGKCLTIAGGESTDNNVVALQFNCETGRCNRQRNLSVEECPNQQMPHDCRRHEFGQ